MPQEPKYGNNGLEFRVFDPETGTARATIRRNTLLRRAKLGAWMLNETKITVAEVFEKPQAIFQGIRNAGDDSADVNCAGWRCFAGVPSTRFLDSGSGARKPNENEVFLIFVTEDMVAYNYRWETVTDRDEWLRNEHPERFDKLIYHIGR